MNDSYQQPEPSTPESDTPRVVVIGSGYAGIQACRTLERLSDDKHELEIILLSDKDHLLYTTMIYEVPVGNLPPSSIQQSVRTMFNNNSIRFRQGMVNKVDLDKRVIHYTPSVSVETAKQQNQTLSYDYVVSAIGSETNFFGVTGAQNYAYTLKDLADAKQLKNRLINSFERASLEPDAEKRKQLLSFVVVGGGPTGVTLAAKIADLLEGELSQAFPKLIDKAEVIILEAGDRPVKPAGVWMSRRISKALGRKPRLTLKTNTYVTEVQRDGVVCDDGEAFFSSRCVIWTAGVKAREFDIDSNDPVDTEPESRRIHVTPELHMPKYPNAYVAGDQAWVERIDSDQPYPMRAQFAVRQGEQAARNIMASVRDKPRKPFAWEDKGMVISAGHGDTYASIYGIKVSGFLATMAYKSIYLMSTVGVRAKARAITEWFMNVFLPRDISEL